MKRLQEAQVRASGSLLFFIMVVVFVVCLGVALDISRLLAARDYMQGMANSSVTAAATAIRPDNPRLLDHVEARVRATNVVSEYRNASYRPVINVSPEVVVLPSEVTVNVDADVPGLVALRFFLPGSDGNVSLSVKASAFPCFSDDVNAPWSGASHNRSCTRPPGDH